MKLIRKIVPMTSWNAVFPFNPLPTPRPDFVVRDTKSGKKVITYYKTEYKSYLAALHSYLSKERLYNHDFEKTVNSKYGIIANIVFYIGVPESVRHLNKFMHTTKGDIDNLIKSVLDGIFNGLKIKDSRVVGVKAVKVNTLTNPRTEINLTGLDDFSSNVSATTKASAEINKYLANTSKLEWQVVFPFTPLPTPRPAYTFKKIGVDAMGKPKYQKHTYNSPTYNKYLNRMDKYLSENHFYNADLENVVNAENGVIFNANFYCKVPKNQKKITKILKTTAPDIDNLLKAAMDGIFNRLSVDDSRVVGVQVLKFNEIERPRTEISMMGLTGGKESAK